ncbi:MAG: putative toxin-antitoxin system toxin component, PIN family [Dehalococcoidia bacterium]|nr:putative toxin-antitoxin system toxin component, PIN family [Dehalococcoidia bacterium]
MPAKPSPLVFLDTNVLFSGLYSPNGPSGRILKHYITGKIRIVVSQLVLEEVVRTIKEKLPVALPAFRILLLNSPPVIVKDPTAAEIARWSKVIDVADAAILASAVTIKPDYLVTGDKHFFANKATVKKARLKIVTPAQFVKEFDV